MLGNDIPGFIDSDDSIFGTFWKYKRKNQNSEIVKNQEYYDNILDDIDTKYIENYLRRKKMKNI